jgi:glycosyltransferase involved in cell wall biosynthesis
VERKGFHHLVRAFGRVVERFPEAQLAIVGAAGEEGDSSAQIRRVIRECNLEERVLLPGAVPHSSLAAWYSAADLFCLASEKEGRANVLLESLACGTPVVATKVWGTPEIISDDSLGILVGSTDPAPLGEALARALSRSWDRGYLVASSRRFSWDGTVGAILEAWSRILNGTHPQGAAR